MLTGYLTDGTVGLLAIKDAGGVTIIQDPEEAAGRAMPGSALDKVAIDYVAGIHDIAALLVQLVAALPTAVDSAVHPVQQRRRFARR